jgi:hypothetical protein
MNQESPATSTAHSTANVRKQMTSKENLILALIQVENISNLVKDNQYYGFMTSHLLPVKYELERQLSLIKSNGVA